MKVDDHDDNKGLRILPNADDKHDNADRMLLPPALLLFTSHHRQLHLSQLPSQPKRGE